MSEISETKQIIPYLCILDFEATCHEDKSSKTRFWPSHEVIEFPSVLLKWVADDNGGQYHPVSEFQEYCKPLHNIQLTDFCKELTGITQEQVLAGMNFPDTLRRHREWLIEQVPALAADQYTDHPSVVIVTCGAWDLVTMMPDECKRWDLGVIDPVYRRVINLKKVYEKVHEGFRGGMARMLGNSKMELLGRHHSGIDDCRNIGRLAQQLVRDGYSWEYKHIMTVEPYHYKVNKMTKKSKKNLLAVQARRT